MSTVNEEPDRGERSLPPELSPRAGRRPVPGRPASSRSRLARLARRALVSMSMATLLLTGGGWLYVGSQFGHIKRIAGLCLAGCAGRPAETGPDQDYLLVGTDTRSGNNSKGNLAGVAEPGGAGQGYGNSDTTLLVRVSPSHQHVVALSFPRDLAVMRPAYSDSTGHRHVAAVRKFNEALSVGGPGLLAEQVTQLSGLPVDHYVSIDFAGFQSMVDAVGGVTVCLSVAAHDPGGDGSGGSNFDSPAGRQTLNGQRALMFVRQRHGLPAGDLDRIHRQQRFMSDLASKVKSTGVLLNPIKINDFLTAVTDNVTIDSHTSQQDLLKLAESLRNLDPSRVAFLTVPTAGQGSSAIGAYLKLDQPKATALFSDVAADRGQQAATITTAASASAAPPPTVAAAIVDVDIRNATTTPGLAGRTAATLRARGFRVRSVGSVAAGLLPGTEIRYGPDQAAAARTLAAAVPGSRLVPVPTAGALSLLLGRPPAGPAPTGVATQPGPSAPAAPAAQRSDCGP